MKKEYIINRQGKDFVLYAGLLDEAHSAGLSRIATSLIQIPHEENGHTAIVSAEVTTSNGTFAGIGDAAPGNVNKMIVPHIIRMAETRAKARAPRDAVNVGEASIEELGGDEDSCEQPAGEHQPPTSRAPEHSDTRPASANQMAAIAKLSRLNGYPEPAADMSAAAASDRITQLSREYNDRKSAIRN